MPLSRLLKQFPGVNFSTPEMFVRSPWLLQAQSCDFWNPEDIADRASAMIVWRSPGVRDTKRIYAPVRDRILNSHRVELMHRKTMEAPEWMLGKCEVSVYQLSATKHLPSVYTEDQIHEILETFMEGDMAFD